MKKVSHCAPNQFKILIRTMVDSKWACEENAPGIFMPDKTITTRSNIQLPTVSSCQWHGHEMVKNLILKSGREVSRGMISVHRFSTLLKYIPPPPPTPQSPLPLPNHCPLLSLWVMDSVSSPFVEVKNCSPSCHRSSHVPDPITVENYSKCWEIVGWIA